MSKKSRNTLTTAPRDQAVPETEVAPEEITPETLEAEAAEEDTRAPIGEESGVNKMTDEERYRTATAEKQRLDVSHYLRMSEYRDKQLFWALSNGEADRWISVGAIPVKRKNKSTIIYPGVNDRLDTEYEMVPAVSVEDGVKIDAFLLFMTKENYKKYRTDPKEARNREIREAMGIGIVDDDAKVMAAVKGLKTYAPHVGNNKKGLDTMHGGELIHDV